MWLSLQDGISLLVLLYLESLVSAVCRVGETLADDGISYPEHKLLVLRVCDLGLVHPEGIHRDPSRVCSYFPLVAIMSISRWFIRQLRFTIA